MDHGDDEIPELTLHIPADAGPHAAALETILRRIPDRWGRGLGVYAGWYPLVIDTDHRRLGDHLGALRERGVRAAAGTSKAAVGHRV